MLYIWKCCLQMWTQRVCQSDYSQFQICQPSGIQSAHCHLRWCCSEASTVYFYNHEEYPCFRYPQCHKWCKDELMGSRSKIYLR